jgi:hypothetical protein
MRMLYRFATVQRSTFIGGQQCGHSIASFHDLMLTEARLDAANHLWIALGPSPNRRTVLHPGPCECPLQKFLSSRCCAGDTLVVAEYQLVVRSMMYS